MKITDESQKKVKYRNKIIEKFQEMMTKSIGKGLNPYKVNVISISVHGF